MVSWFIFFVVIALVAGAFGMRTMSRAASRIAFGIAALAIVFIAIVLLMFGWADPVPV